MDIDPKKENLKSYRTFGLPLLVLMTLLAAAGVLAAVLWHFFFNI